MKSHFQIEQLNQIMAILTSKIRLNIFYLLMIHKRLSLGELHTKMGKAKATIVHHMKKFEKTKLIFEKHEKSSGSAKIIKIYEINPDYVEMVDLSPTLYWSQDQLKNPKKNPDILEFYLGKRHFNTSFFKSMQIIFEKLIQKNSQELPDFINSDTLVDFLEKNNNISVIPLNDELFNDYRHESNQLMTKYQKLAKLNYERENSKEITNFAYHFLLPASVIADSQPPADSH